MGLPVMPSLRFASSEAKSVEARIRKASLWNKLLFDLAMSGFLPSHPALSPDPTRPMSLPLQGT